MKNLLTVLFLVLAIQYCQAQNKSFHITGSIYNRENETYNFLKRNVQFSLFFTPSKQRHLITI